MAARVRVGTCSWADKTMIKAWYPREVRTPEDRLRYYASQFDTVEIDSSFYALPSKRNASLWAQRTPQGFIFHVKAFGLMTGHSVPEDRLPPALREHEYSRSRYGNVRKPSPAMLRETFSLFRESIEPLREAGKLGVILLQFPPYFTAKTPRLKEQNTAYLRSCRTHLAGYNVAVEFRHRSWLAGSVAEDTLSFLRSQELGHVCVDAPELEDDSVVPMITQTTSSTGYFRLHGRNRTTWKAKVPSAAERFRYLYSPEELSQIVYPVRQLEKDSETVYVMFNNCYGDYAPRNALTFKSLIT